MELRDDEIRRLLKYLDGQIENKERLAQIEDELRGEFGAEFLREPLIASHFPERILDFSIAETNWRLKIIGYTRLRMVQRGINQETIVNLFKKFVEYCRAEEQPITVGAYTIYGKPEPRAKSLTLRIDVDNIGDQQNAAHTVTIFVGRGNTSETEVIELM